MSLKSKTNKDRLFKVICCLWFITGIIAVFRDATVGEFNFADRVSIINMFWMTVMAVLIIFKYSNKKFNKWLNRPIFR